MTNTETPAALPPPKTITREAFDTRYRALVALLKQNGHEAQARVAAHIRALTQGRYHSLAFYHVAESIPLEEKHAEYARISAALGLGRDEHGKAGLGAPDWGRLCGQHGEPEPQRADPLAEKQEPEQESPAPRNHPPLAAGSAEPPTAEVRGDTHDLATVLAEAIRGKLRLPPPPAEWDEHKVRHIVSEAIDKLDLGEQVKRANHNGAFPAERVQQLIADALANTVRRVELVTPDGEIKPLTGLVHKSFETVLRMTRCRVASGHPVPLWLDGPPGGGKSHLMEQVAEALGLAPYILAIGPSDTKTLIIGSIATGEFKPGIAYQPYKEGGLLGIDEIAAGDPGVLVSLNCLVANQTYRFPGGELVRKHPNFHVIVADNTRGHGNVKGMIRNRLDAATLDRFAFLRVDYDEQLEAALCGNAKWAAYVKQVRDYLAGNSGESVYITPRASLNGAALLAGGLDPETVANATVFKFCSPDLKQTILASIGSYQP